MKEDRIYFIVYDTIYMTLWKRQNQVRKEISGGQGLGVEEGDALQRGKR